MDLTQSDPMSMIPPSIDARRNARHLFWMGWRVTDIADALGLLRPTVESWKQRDKWDEASPLDRVEGATEARYVALVSKPIKSGQDFKEIDLLGRQLAQFARIRRYEQPGGHEGDLNEKVGARNELTAAGGRKKPTRNCFTDNEAIELRRLFEENQFGYQRRWMEALEERTRAILKSRQIGATYYFAREALVDAVETGRNQIFLSASKAQAHVFKSYIVAFAESVGVKLTGDPIILSNGAEMHFLGTNARTAQSYHGNFYFDEFFWVYGFTNLNSVASGMAMHKKWRKTYFSTPSSVTHEAYPFWTGERFNKRRAKTDQADFELGHKALASGRTGPDKIWRNIVTIHDAEREGCDLFDIEELRLEYSVDEFANLLGCQFLDDKESFFPLAFMQVCLVDSWVDWTDLKPLSPRPFGNGEVWLGYDPQESEDGDNAGLAVIAPPRVPGGKFRLLEKQQFRGLDFQQQADVIRSVTQRYNVGYIGIDVQGVGAAVWQLVKQFFPTAERIEYNVATKTRLILKAKNVIRTGRFEYDSGWNDVTGSFMAIRKVLTASGEAVTYRANRAKGTGHADLAFAIMHAIGHEPLEGNENPSGKSMMELS